MSSVRDSEQGVDKQPITLLTRSATKMEATPHPGDIIDPLIPSAGIPEKEYIDFIDLASHELDAPLRKLSLLAERLTEKLEMASQNKDVHAYIERINHCVGDMRSVVDSISVLAKTASEKRDHGTVNMEEIVTRAIDSLTVPVKSVNAVIHVSSPLPSIPGDTAQLFRLFKNLIENAIKFGRENIAPEVTIRSSVADSAETERFRLPANLVYHKLEITDNGMGFKNEYAAKIFRPFVRLHGKSRFAGTGVGLAICKKIVDNHGGIIYADSRENEGSRFVLLLPEMR